ncbi:MAG TPA: hypothetical protein VKX96_12445 [Chloroflexota bacterium]|nr:hypothetical protein [Chloroflexota bacterium]
MKFRHLTRRFFAALSARVEPSDLVVLEEFLNGSERALFLKLSAADQRHSLDLFRRLWNDGHQTPDLLRAALLHDVGKAAGPLPLAFRVVYSLAAGVNARWAAWLGAPERPGLFRPFYLAAHHPILGAQAAECAGSNPNVVRLIAGHGSPGGDALSKTLYHYDGQM